MIRAFFFLLLVPLLACADPMQMFFENEDPTIFHHVNVITGNLNICFQDTLVQGAQPIPITRTYSSAGALERVPHNLDLILKSLRGGWIVQGGWNLFPHTNLLLDASHGRGALTAYLPEPSGHIISYAYSHHSSKHTIVLKPTNTISQVSGKLSSRTNSQNNLLQIDLKTGAATLFLPDGGQRIYRGPSLHKYDGRGLGKFFYLLHTEKLPSGHQLRYIHDPTTTHLKRIESTNPAGTKVYAAIDIDCPGSEIALKTSDGKQIQYQKTLHENREYINAMQSNCCPHERFHLTPGRKGIGARLASIAIAGQEPFSVQYYLPANIHQERKWAKQPEKKEFHIDKVQTIFAPVGLNGAKVAIASFTYYPNRTDARDADGLLIRYHHNAEHLTLIEYFDDHDQLHSSQQLYWEGTKLRCKAMFDENRKTSELPECADEKGQKYLPILHFGYDIHGNLALSETPLKEKTQTSYNLFRKPTCIIQADNTQIRHFYHTNGTLHRTLYPDGTEVRYTYDLFKRQTSKTIYSEKRQPLASEEWTYNPFQLLSYTDTRGLQTRFTYDGAGRKIAEEAEDRTVTFAYDPLGFLEKTDNGITALLQKRNVEGLVEEQWEEESTGRIENWMKFFYDNENRKEKALRKTSQGESVDRFSYANGKLSSHIDPNGRTTTIVWNEYFKNELNQTVLQKTTTDPVGQATIETYDAGERIVSRDKKNPQGQTIFKERFFYDPSGNLKQRTSYVYTNGIPLKEIFINWKYDAMGRVQEETESDQKTTLYDYDVRGRLECKTLPSGTRLHYFYDGADRLEELASSDGQIHYRYSYEMGPDPVQISDLVAGMTLTRRYNLFGQVTCEMNSRGLSSQWSYDSIGRCISFQLPDGSSIAYPTQGAHIGAVQRKGPRGTLLYEHRYRTFDCNGHVSEEERIFDLGAIQTTHDLLERPSSQSCLQMEQSIAYGPSGLVSKSYNSLFGEKAYKYDSLNQLQEEGDQTYDFDSLGNPIEFAINDLNQISATPECMLGYDDNGNPAKKVLSDRTIEYQFDPLGRLTEITTAQQKKVLYFYDPLSRLFAKETYTYTSNAWKKEKKIFYLYDRDREIGTQDEQGCLLELKVLGLGIRGDIGAAVALEIGRNIYAPLHDFQGNIVAIVSLNGKIAETYEMNAFGKERSPALLNPWRFSSKRSEEGLFFFGYRFYDPTLGRWLTPDPMGFVDGANLYAFVQNSPLNRLDLFGLFSDDSFGQVHIHVPPVVIPRLPGFHTFLAKGSIGGIEVDFVLCCGHWHQLQFTPEEIKMDQVDIMNHLHELTPSQGTYFGLVTVGNGIDTSLGDCFKMSMEVGHTVGDTLLMALHNPTEGVRKDIKRTNQERAGVETPIVCLMRQFMATTGEKLYHINPQSLWLCIPHSENGVILKRAIEGMTETQQQILQKILHIFAVGPAEPLSGKQGVSVINVYSEKDYVTGFGPYGYAKYFMNHPDYDIRKLTCQSSIGQRNLFIADHGFLQPTYRTGWKDHINDLKGKFKFYTGSEHESTR